MTAYTIYTYDSVEVGQELDPVEHHVTAEMVRDYAEATGDRSPWHTGAESPFGEAVAHPALVTVFTTAVLERSAKGGPSGGIHAKQEYEFLAPIRIGSTITTRSTVTEKFIRKGRKTVVYQSESVDERGVTVARCRVTNLVPQ